jgi:hypothetical protein
MLFDFSSTAVEETVYNDFFKRGIIEVGRDVWFVEKSTNKDDKSSEIIALSFFKYNFILVIQLNVLCFLYILSRLTLHIT